MLSASKASETNRVEKAMDEATSYKEWKALAIEHDQISGRENWKKVEKSAKYDHANIRSRLNMLRDLRSRGDHAGLLFALNEGIHGNQGGMGSSRLFTQAKFGTKQLIEDYVDELVGSLKDISNVPEDVISWNDKRDFFQRASLCFGRSALMLSGAGSLGHFHGGVVKTLLQHGLLPDVISGSSAGSIFAAILGTNSDKELRTMFRRRSIMPTIAGANTDEPVPVDSAHVRLMLEAAIPEDLTFQEAYEKTGRKISVTIAPLEEHQTSRLMNAVTSPNVFIRSAVQASCAVPGVFPPVMLMAKNVYGETQPYLPNRRWVDGAVTDDLPAKRLARLYSVNHYIVSQANPVVLAMSAADNNPFLPEAMKNVMRYSTHEWLKSSERFSRRYLSSVPEVGKALSMFYSVVAQDYKGDVNIAPSFTYFDPKKLLAQLGDDDIAYLTLEGERATWPQLERIRISSKIGKTLDVILDEHAEHDVKTSYKKRVAAKDQKKKKG
jgi:TAG lipase/steryl ester hydrolase/phospholipase A2/LPA acyltransferase